MSFPKTWLISQHGRLRRDVYSSSDEVFIRDLKVCARSRIEIRALSIIEVMAKRITKLEDELYELEMLLPG